MRQVLQSLRTGATEIAEVPCPALPASHLLVRTTRSLVSAGTERMLVEFGRSGLIEKARQQPDKVRMVLDKVRTDGLLPTIEAVRSKLEQPLALGYCNVGRVIDVAEGVTGFAVGDRVASNGRHADVVSVPANASARVPDQVGDDEAAFTVLGAVALQGIRLVQPTLGEAFAVTGLGLVGLLTVQLLRAHGCRVLGLDLDPERLALARSFGAEVVAVGSGADPVREAERFSRGAGMDGVIITASTRSSEPIHQAAQMCRKRGRIVLVGVTGLELSRADFYDKELTFQVSCSYGPGRHDPNYEQRGLDYPIGYVRWTEQRNFEAVLDMMADGRLDVRPLISHRFEMTDATRAYEVLAGAERSLGILLTYPQAGDRADAGVRRTTVRLAPETPSPAVARTALARAVGVAVLGSGNYASRILIPALGKAGARLITVASSGGVSGLHAARKFGFAATTTAADEAIGELAVDAVVIATRHDSHAGLVVQALQAGKHVFVEKPLALTPAELDAIAAAYRAAASEGRPPVLMVGFNRRFAPHVQRMRQLLAGRPGPSALIMTVNAGRIPLAHWTQDRDVGGGRIVGEGCHFVDLLRFLAGAPIVGHTVHVMAAETADTATINLDFADGSTGTVHYLSNGSTAFPKERLEVFTGGRVLQLDNFVRLKGYGWPGFRRMSSWQQDKGQAACIAAFLDAIRTGGASPIAYDEIMEVSRVTLALAANGPAA